MKCEECIHFCAESYGDGWNEPRETEYGCELEDKEENIDRYFDKKEAACPYYNPGKCDVCGKPIKNEYVFWAIGPYSDFKCCSEECQKRI